jgi:STIMATE family
MKVCVLIIFLVFPWISKIGDWALSWTEGNEKLQIAFVMMIFPLIMNAMQYYIIDSFIKEKETPASGNHERLPSEDPEERRAAFGEDAEGGEELLTGTDSEDDDGRHQPHHSQRSRKKHRPRLGEDEYDPDKDGENHATSGMSGGSSNRLPTTVKVVQPELFPKE